MYFSKKIIRNFRADEDFKTIRTRLLQDRLLYTDLKFAMYTIGPDKEYRTPRDLCNRPVFINGQPSRFDALQGASDDCWVVTAMEVLTSNEDLMKHVVPPDQGFDHNYAGIFHFRFWDLGTWVDVVVDDRLPVFKEDTQKLYYTHSMSGNVFWAALLEKAYAKFCTDKDQWTASYDSLDIGNPMNPLQDFSGGIVEWISTKDPPPGTTMKWFLNRVYDGQALMTCHFTKKLEFDLNLFPKHTYAVTKLARWPDDHLEHRGLYLMRVMNPWGNSEWTGLWNDNDWDRWSRLDPAIWKQLDAKPREDGEFWMDERDFVRYFERIFICHLGPTEFIDSREDKEHYFTWSIRTFKGEWVKDISAGGSSLPTRHMNPQYQIYVQKPKYDSSTSGKYTVIMELVQKFKPGLEFKPIIGIFIYHMDLNKKHLSVPLDDDFFLHNDPMVKHIQYHGRSFVTTASLDPGSYVLVPHCYKWNDEAQYLLRVYTQSNEMVVVLPRDIKVSKSLPIEEQKLSDCDERVIKLFGDRSQGREEIDWLDLQDILDTAMNEKWSYFGIIVSLFNRLWAVLNTYISLELSNAYQTGDVVFTKDECRSLIAMFDDDHSGKISYSEFINLWNKIGFWTKVFEQHKDDSKQHLTTSQMRDALSAIGYNINKRTAHSLSYIYADEQKQLFLTDFILCGVTLDTVLGLCQKLNLEDEDECVFTLEEWVKNTLFL